MIAATLPLFLFAVAALFSPGPNVVMLTASGARFGFRRTLPHLIGVAFGTGLLGAFAGFGVAGALLAVPGLKLAFQITASAWILYLAWRIARAGRAGRGGAGDRPMTFAQAVAFQAVNPKLWAVSVAAASGFGIGLSPEGEAARLFIVFGGVNLGSCLFWTTAGHLLSGVLAEDRIWRIFMAAMGALLASTVILIFL